MCVQVWAVSLCLSLTLTLSATVFLSHTHTHTHSPSPSPSLCAHTYHRAAASLVSLLLLAVMALETAVRRVASPQLAKTRGKKTGKCCHKL